MDESVTFHKLSSSLKKILIIGSSPDALRVKHWPKADFSSLVAINNAWQIREDWDYLIHAGDFPSDRMPAYCREEQTIYTYDRYVPIQNQYGGFVYAGGTMAFTAAYWALGELKPDVMAFVGCDMVYPKNQLGHFYGQGEADPLRDDMTLQSLEAKSRRLQLLSFQQHCVCVNLTSWSESRLVFPRLSWEELSDFNASSHEVYLQDIQHHLYQKALDDALAEEKSLSYFVESGEYWKCFDQFDANKLSDLDQLWLNTQCKESE